MEEVNKIIQGDTLQVLKTFPSESIDCVITSPPYYGLRDYGTAKWEGGDKKCDHLGKPHSTQAGFNERYTGKSPVLIDKQGELRELFKDVCGKCGARRIDAQLGLEKTLDEYLDKMLAITLELKRVLKKTGTMFWNHGDSYASLGRVGGDIDLDVGMDINRGRSRIRKGTYSEKCLMLQNYRLAQRMIDEQKWILRNTIIWHKPNCMPSSVKDRFTVDYEPVFFFTKAKKYWFETQFEQFKSNNYDLERMANARTEYGGKWAQESGGAIKTQRAFVAGGSIGRNKRSVWKIPTKPYSEAHFATFPPALIQPMVKAGCPPKGIILDPFMGSGTTALVARSLGRNYLGIELNQKYIDMANRRLAQKVLF